MKLHNNNITYSRLNKYFTQKFIWAIFEDSKNRIWSNNYNLSYINENGKLIKTPSGEFDLHNIYAFYEDRTGAILIGYHFGLLRYYNNTFTRYSTDNGMSDNEVRAIFEDNKGNIWAGTTNGLNKIINGKVEAFKSIHGLRNNYIRAIYQDKDGVLWFGSYGGGLIRYKGNKFFIFTTDDGLFDNVISQIVEDDDGYFWMGCNRGIQRISRNELNDYADGKKSSFFVQTYDKYDGMISAETNGGFQPSAVKDAKGDIYFPTIKGLVVVNTKEIKENKKIPPVYIEKVLVDGKEKDPGDLQIDYDSSNVEIHFSVLSYTAPKKDQAKYIMEGFDREWTKAGNLRYARYNNLPPGKYTFKVIASNNDNVWNEKGASVAITVLPPYWMTWWFRSILVALFLSIGPIIYYRRVAALKRQHKLQHEFSEKLINSQEQERSRIAQELHDSLGQELLLIKNRAVLGLKNLANGSKTKQQIEYISEYAGNAIKQVRQISHNLRPPELDRLGLTETLRSIISEFNDTEMIKMTGTIENIDGLIEKEKEINLLRILQESIANTIKHSGAAEIKIKVVNLNNTIKVSIADNGKGFDSEFNPAVKTKGLGFSGMNERAKILGGVLLVESAPGKGTKIKLEIPIKYA